MSASQSKYEGADNISYMILFKNGVNHRVDGILGCVVSDHVPNTPSCFHHSKIHLKVLQKKKWQSQIFYMQLHTWRMSLSFLLHLEKKKKNQKSHQKKKFSPFDSVGGETWKKEIYQQANSTVYENIRTACVYAWRKKKVFIHFFFFFSYIIFSQSCF